LFNAHNFAFRPRLIAVHKHPLVHLWKKTTP
jgi:hypothetical protein